MLYFTLAVCALLQLWKCLDKINPNLIPEFFFLGCKDLWVLRWLSSLCVSSPLCRSKHHFLFCHKVGQQHSKYCTFLNVTATWSVVDLHPVVVVVVLQCIFFKASCCHVVWCCCLVLFTCPFPTNNPTGSLWDPFKVFMICCQQLFKLSLAFPPLSLILIHTRREKKRRCRGIGK